MSGLPLRLDGREGPGRRACAFGAQLEAAAIHYCDERMTTQAADRVCARLVVAHPSDAHVDPSPLHCFAGLPGRGLVGEVRVGRVDGGLHASALRSRCYSAASLAAGLLLFGYARRAPAVDATTVVALTLDSGMGPRGVSQRRSGRGVVASALLFELYLRVQLSVRAHIRVGRVVLETGLSPAALLPRVVDGVGRVPVRVTIPEGWTRFDVAERLDDACVCDAAGFLRASEDAVLLRAEGVAARTAEGYLFPETYEFYQFTPARQVVARLSPPGVPSASRSRSPRSGAAGAPNELGWSPDDADAGIDCREGNRLPAERATIAGVYLNRLRSPRFVPNAFRPTRR